MASNETTEYRVVADKIVSPDEDIVIKIAGGVYMNSFEDQNRLVTFGDIQDLGGGTSPGIIPVRGSISRQTPGTVSITTANVYVPLNLSGTLQTGETLRNMMAAEGIGDVSGLRNTGDTKTLAVIATYEGKAANNQSIGLKLAINGVPLNETECTSFGGPGGQFAKTMTQWLVHVGNGDEITMWVANKDGTEDLSIARYKMIAYAI